MKYVILVLLAATMSGCVSTRTIQAVQVGDENKSCEVLMGELSQLGVRFDEAKDESGFTGKNVGMAILFWPGIFVNESRASRNQDSVDRRITHLTGIYNRKCLSQTSE